MKFSASAAFILLVCVVYVHAYGPHRPTTHRPVHPWRPTHHRPTHRPMKNSANSNVNINSNKNSNANLAWLFSELFSNQETESPCTSGCYEKKALIKSGDDAVVAAVDAKKAAESTEKVLEKEAAPVAPAPVAPAGDANLFDQFFAKFAEFQDDDAFFAASSEFDGSDDDFFA